MSPKNSGIEFQTRDLAFLRDLFSSRIMTALHAAALHFDSSGEATKKRLYKLKGAGVIAERKRNVNQHSALFLTNKGYALLKENGMLEGYPVLDTASFVRRAYVSELKINHELEVIDVKAAFHIALRKSQQFKLSEFSTWPHLYSFTALGSGGKSIPVRPDGFIQICENENGKPAWEHTFFLEVDRSNETLDILAAKGPRYQEYYRSGGFAVWNGGSRDQIAEHGFRVIMVLKSAERRNNIAEKLLQATPPILSQVWLSTFGEVTTDPLGPIWIRPQDYREVTRETPFDPDNVKSNRVYRTQVAREILVESKIKKLPLLADL